MTDQEINEQVARKLGWNKLAKLDDSTGYLYGWKFKGELANPPDYCHSIEAAWEILEKKQIALVPTNTGWFATSRDAVLEEGECLEIWIPSGCATRDHCGCLRCAIADTAPMAICLAFLKLEDGR